ncbi:hypothetical protein FGIG_12470 [Fasciola gigantica]|uniref:Uncharacterized protein n=1 Tax=Fasciola gigantica TaxID=46835 RepID=A0A504Y7D5_FASGI|nr:hypothetical protein FGIG_12470 [Fasciola gigantica]
MKIFGAIDSEVFEIKVARQGFRYSTSQWKEIKSLPEEDRISRKYRKRLELEDCLRRKQHELRNSSRLFTFWHQGFEGISMCGHLWTYGFWHEADKQRLRSLYVSCASSINLIALPNDHEVQGMNGSPKNTDKDSDGTTSGITTTDLVEQLGKEQFYLSRSTHLLFYSFIFSFLSTQSRIHHLPLQLSTYQFYHQYLNPEILNVCL